MPQVRSQKDKKKKKGKRKAGSTEASEPPDLGLPSLTKMQMDGAWSLGHPSWGPRACA